MKRSIKIGLIILVLIVSATIIFTATSDRIFITTMLITPDNTVKDLKGEGYELSFYMYGNEDSERKVKIGTTFHDVQKSGENLVHIIIKIIPEYGLKVDSLHLELNSLQPVSAFMLENPESGQSDPYIYQRIDKNSSVVLNYPKLNTETSEIITINSWLDLSRMSAITEDRLLVISFSMHEESIFKMVNYEANSAINLAIPFTAQ